MEKYKNISNQKFDKLTALSFQYTSKKHAYWLCICECGKNKIVSSSNLISREVKSCGCKHGRPPGEAAKHHLFLCYKNRAKKHKREFLLEEVQFNNLISMDCHYCGIEPIQNYKLKGMNGYCIYNGLDRKDNKKGYIIDNVVPCCKTCNKAKRTLSYEEFINWITRLTNNQLLMMGMK